MTDPYEKDIQNWRKQMDQALRAENGWLALAGLHWLKAGVNTMGADPASDIVLPTGRASQYTALFHYAEDEVVLHASEGAQIEVDGEKQVRARLQPDTTGSPSRIGLGELSMVLIQRGERFGIRLWDNARQERDLFPGRSWYPVAETCRLPAIFTPADEDSLLQIPDVLGDVHEEPLAGWVDFTMEDLFCRLAALETGAKGLFLIFKDLTNGLTTYPAGRFLVIEPPFGDKIWIDFNRAYNPPCAFTDFATCPLPPAQNHLQVAVQAGEKYLKWEHA